MVSSISKGVLVLPDNINIFAISCLAFNICLDYDSLASIGLSWTAHFWRRIADKLSGPAAELFDICIIDVTRSLRSKSTFVRLGDSLLVVGNGDTGSSTKQFSSGLQYTLTYCSRSTWAMVYWLLMTTSLFFNGPIFALTFALFFAYV